MKVKRRRISRGRVNAVVTKVEVLTPDVKTQSVSSWKWNDTQGAKKLRNYLDEILRSDFFQEEIYRLRKTYEIPEEGYARDQAIDEFAIPNSWRFMNDEVMKKKLLREIQGLCRKLHLHGYGWHTIIWDYLFFSVCELSFPHNVHSYDLCIITDAMENMKNMDIQVLNAGHVYTELDRDEQSGYPIAIRVSPYASLRDIKDFVLKHRAHIEILQKKYRDPHAMVGKVRKRDPGKQERNRFIYNHRDLPLKEIRKLASKQFDERLDDGLIGKIISLERKKRKNL